MLLTAPEPTPYDLRFRLLGFPVRVHPLFWLMIGLLGGVGVIEPENSLVFIACAFVSILVHELGHALAFRACGHRAEIVLYQMGGLAIPDDDERRPWQRLGIVLAGPGAGFTLLALTLVGFGVAYALPLREWAYLCAAAMPGQGLARLWASWVDLRTTGFSPGFQRLSGSNYASLICIDLIQINLVWNLLNLLPIFPLDGGQAARVLLVMQNRAQGAYRTHVVSLVVAGIIAVYFLQKSDLSSLMSLYPVLLFGMLALQNFQILQYFYHHNRHGGFGDDAEDWWKR